MQKIALAYVEIPISPLVSTIANGQPIALSKPVTTKSFRPKIPNEKAANDLEAVYPSVHPRSAGLAASAVSLEPLQIL
jgi:hypothetical protein